MWWFSNICRTPPNIISSWLVISPIYRYKIVYPHDIPSISIWTTWKSPKPKSKYETLRQKKTHFFQYIYIFHVCSSIFREMFKKKKTTFSRSFMARIWQEVRISHHDLSSRLTGSNLLMSLFPFLLHLSTWIGPSRGPYRIHRIRGLKKNAS